MPEARVTWARDAGFRLWEIACGRRLAHGDDVWEVRAIHAKSGTRRLTRAKLPSDQVSLVKLNGETEERSTMRAGELYHHQNWLLLRLNIEDKPDEQ